MHRVLLLCLCGAVAPAFFAATPAGPDRDPDAGEALADLRHHLPGVRREPERRGVRLWESYRDTIVVARGAAKPGDGHERRGTYDTFPLSAGGIRS